MEDMFRVLCATEKEALVLARYFTKSEKLLRLVKKIHERGENSWQEILRMGRVLAVDRLSKFTMYLTLMGRAVRGDKTAEATVFRMMDKEVENLVISAGRANKSARVFKLNRQKGQRPLLTELD